MPVDYLGLRQQAKEAAGKAGAELELVKLRRAEAGALLSQHANNLEDIRNKVRAAAAADPRLRCAIPTTEPLDQPQPDPPSPKLLRSLPPTGRRSTPTIMSLCITS